jgi:hypothetical protein
VESSISFQLPSLRDMQTDGAHDLFNLENEPDGKLYSTPWIPITYIDEEHVVSLMQLVYLRKRRTNFLHGLIFGFTTYGHID